MIMNGEIPSVPITTLAGVASLTDLLRELPLPTPLPATVNNKSLLYHPKIVEEAKRILATQDETLISQLVQALRQTSTEHIELKDSLASDTIEGDVPELLKGILRADPKVFERGQTPATNHQSQSYGQQGRTFNNSTSISTASASYSPYQQNNVSPSRYSISHSQQISPAQFSPSSLHNSSSNVHPASPAASHQVAPSTRSNNSSHQGASSTRSSSSSHFGHASQNALSNNHSQHASVNGECVPPVPSSGGYSTRRRSGHNAYHQSLVSSPVQASIAEPPVRSHLTNSDHNTSRVSNSGSTPSHADVTTTTTAALPGTDRRTAKAPAVVLDALSLNQPVSGRRRSSRETLTSKEPDHHTISNKDRLASPPNASEQRRHSGSNSSATAQRSSSSVKEVSRPVVVLEPFDREIHKSLQNKKGTATAATTQPELRLGHGYKISSISGFGSKLTYHLTPSRGNKRRRSGEEKHPSSSYNASLTERVKRRRRNVSYRDRASDDDASQPPSPIALDDDYSGSESRPETPIEVLRKRERKKQQRRDAYLPQFLSAEDLLDSDAFKRFSTLIDGIFETVEEIDLTSIDLNDEETECPSDIMIAKVTMGEMNGEVAKLKAQEILNQVPAEKLVKLLTILLWNIKDGTKLLPNIAQDEDEDEGHLWRDLMMERVIRSMDAALVAINIMTAPDMPKQVFLEDVIEKIMFFTKFQLHNTVYPAFDPVYRIDPKAKDGYHSSYKMKRARAGQVKDKLTILLYNKLTELGGSLAALVEIQELTDITILQMSSLGVSTFFVENISELQLNAMKLVTCIFARYAKHRQLILEDIFASLARLPSTKRNLRNYRLNADESIQMVTALALQLIQCVVHLPSQEPTSRPSSPSEDQNSKQTNTVDPADNDLMIVTSYETSMRTGYNFLSVFLKKCTTKGDEDYRPMFENFVHDLLATVNKPEWPASELLLSLLGRILVQQFSNKAVEMSLRTASLEYLGIVAARLRKDALSSQFNQEIIDDIVDKVHEDDKPEDEVVRNKRSNKKQQQPDKENEDQTQSLQRAILEYLAYNGESEPAMLFARQFYIAQWFRDSAVEVEKQEKSRKDHEDEFDATEAERTTEVHQHSEKRKSFLLTQIKSELKPFSSFKPSPSKLDYDDACLVARYLSSQRPFAQSFDIYLTQILRVLSETAVAVRTKAMKCLTAVVESDPGILARTDMQKGVHGRFLDQSTSVREAAIELVGRFIIIRPELIPNYYEMLSERILDTGISVRKRVIKIFKDICLDQPDFSKIPEMCVKMIRRVNDEEGIKKLVNEVFQMMWFTPVRIRDEPKLLQKVFNITEVVMACKDTGLDYFEQLVENLLRGEEGKEKETPVSKAAMQACRQICDCLVENVLAIEEKTVELTDGRSPSSQRLIACLSTLFLFSKIKPELMVKHATTLQPYLDIKCSAQGDFLVLHNVARILELVVPLMDHPSESFLAQLEEDMMKLVLRHGMMVVESCVSCLGSVINGVSHNYRLVKDCFRKFFGVLCKLMEVHQSDSNDPMLAPRKPTLLRSLFTVGLLCKHFDFDSKEMGETKMSVRDRVFEVLLYFIDHEDEEVKNKALIAMGFMCTQHYEYMMAKKLKDIYDDMLANPLALIKLKCQVLTNLQVYLLEEEIRMTKADAEWKKTSKTEDLKEMGDVQSGMASTIMQIYLKQTLEAFFHIQAQVRHTALSVISLVLSQGLVHPVQCVPYLVSMGTDTEQQIRIKADQSLQEIEKKYPGFIHMKALQGMKMSYRLQLLLQLDPCEPVRGSREDNANNPISLNACLYTVLRSNRTQRRAFSSSLLNLFDDSARATLSELVYVADNLAFFPYQAQDEALYIMHQIDIIVSVSGCNLLQTFREALLPKPGCDNLNASGSADDDDDEDDIDFMLTRIPEDTTSIKDVLRISQGCVLLLVLKQHLKELYGFTDNKTSRYSPTESAKVWDKPVTRKVIIAFNPTQALEMLRNDDTHHKEQTDETKRAIIEEFIDFKQLMLSIDPPDEDDDAQIASGQTPMPFASRVPNERGDHGTIAVGEDEGETLDQSGDGTTPTTAIVTPHTAIPIQSTTVHRSHHQSPARVPHRYQNLSSERKRGRHERKSTPKPIIKKKAKKRKRKFESDDESDDSDDPDWA